MKDEDTIKILEWYPVGTISLNSQVETCAICRNNILDICVACQKGGAMNEEKCSVAWGKCSHAFHYHCISKWLRSRQLCPLDSKKWEYIKQDE